VDRAALDAARALGLSCGGWCPKGRKAEDGPLDPRYPLRETPSEDYAQRTEWNVRDSDGTLILAAGRLSGGTASTAQRAAALRKPCLIVDLEHAVAPATIRAWLKTHRIRTLNVAGPRESRRPGIYAEASRVLRSVFSLAGRRP